MEGHSASKQPASVIPQMFSFGDPAPIWSYLREVAWLDYKRGSAIDERCAIFCIRLNVVLLLYEWCKQIAC